MSTTPLKAGDVVKLLPSGEQREIACAVAAGFKAWTADAIVGMGGRKVGMTVYRWHDRGVSWQSDKLDRIDSTRTQFSNAVHDGGKTA
jgi:hypothetical protein